MTNREAMKMALDALETRGEHHERVYAAIEALRQALAQPEPNSEAYGYAKYLAECIWEKHYKEESPHWRPSDNTLSVLTQIDNMTCGLEKAQFEQEPVAWVKDGLLWNSDLPEKFTGCLYTAPPSKPWVSLTDEEREYLWGITPEEYVDKFAFSRAVEAKLKEKNT